MKIKSVTIGISTYGPLPRSQFLIRSIKQNMQDKGGYDVKIVLCDDGTDQYLLPDRRRFCKAEGVTLLEQETNSGIPRVWNRITQENLASEAIIIFSDGIRILMSGWLSRLIFFLENNENIGMVGLPHIPDPSLYDASEARYDLPPGRVGASVGCSFAYLTDKWKLVKNQDGSVGFFEDYVSFHEEIDFGFKLAQLGYSSWMLSEIPSYYRGGMAFGAHPELIWREPSPYLPVDEFLFWVRQSKFFVPQYEESYKQNQVDRMSYSRIYFAKIWGALDECRAGRRHQQIKDEMVDVLDESPKLVHARLIDTFPPQEVRYLDRQGNVRTGVS